jgi:hypothetical protein
MTSAIVLSREDAEFCMRVCSIHEYRKHVKACALLTIGSAGYTWLQAVPDDVLNDLLKNYSNCTLILMFEAELNQRKRK